MDIQYELEQILLIKNLRNYKNNKEFNKNLRDTYSRGWFSVTETTKIVITDYGSGYMVIEMNFPNNNMYYFKIYTDNIIHKKKTGFVNLFKWETVIHGNISIGLNREMYEQYMFLEDHIDIDFNTYKLLLKIVKKVTPYIGEEPKK